MNVTSAFLEALAGPDWHQRAACRGTGPDLFFADGAGDHSAEAKAVCRGCVARPQCLEAGLDNNERYGVWGGYTDKELQKIRQRRRWLRDRGHLQTATPADIADTPVDVDVEPDVEVDAWRQAAVDALDDQDVNLKYASWPTAS